MIFISRAEDGRKSLLFVWKKDQKDKKNKQNLKLALITLLFLGLLLIFGRVLQFFSEFQKPFYSFNTTTHRSAWDGKSVINVIIARVKKSSNGNDLTELNFVSLNPKDSKVTVLKLSDEIFLDVPRNYGEWKLGNIYKLGQENNPKIGEDLVKMSVSKMLALPVDGLIEVDRSKNLDIQEMMGEWKQNIFLGFNFLTNIKTDLSLKEATSFVFQASKIRSDKVTSVDLFRSTITQSKLLPDSSRVLGVDGVKLDTFIKQTLSDSSISDEDLTVGIFNGTNHPGLTGEAVRLVNNLGARVTIINNTTDKFVKSGIYMNTQGKGDIQSSATYKRLAEIFAPYCITDGCTTNDSEITSSRAAINIVLGEDYFTYWMAR